MRRQLYKKIAYIYKTTNLVNGKIYVGQHSTTLKSDNYLGNGVYLNGAIKKYGRSNFKIEILLKCLPCKNYLNLKEIEYIKKNNCVHPNGYNLSNGGAGNGGVRHSEESKIKIGKSGIGRIPWNKGKKGLTSAWNKGITGYKLNRTKQVSQEFRDRLREVNLGKTIPQEVRDKISKTTKGRTKSEETRKKLRQYRQGLPELKCPHCGIKSKARLVMDRWHFDKCKLNPNRIEYSKQNKPKKETCPHCNKTCGTNVVYRFHFDNCKFKNNLDE